MHAQEVPPASMRKAGVNGYTGPWVGEDRASGATPAPWGGGGELRLFRIVYWTVSAGGNDGYFQSACLQLPVQTKTKGRGKKMMKNRENNKTNSSLRLSLSLCLSLSLSRLACKFFQSAMELSSTFRCSPSASKHLSLPSITSYLSHRKRDTIKSKPEFVVEYNRLLKRDRTLHVISIYLYYTHIFVTRNQHSTGNVYRSVVHIDACGAFDSRGG